MTPESYEQKTAMRVSAVSIIVNLFLSVIKLLAGILAHSAAMISDAVHSASDVFSTFIVIIGVSIASKKSDTQHPYGHERLECVASILLSVLLALTGFGIGKTGFKKILAGHYESLVIPGTAALLTAVLSILVKEWMYHYTRKAAESIHSGALMADAWHHRSDSLSSIGAFIGIAGARMGFPVLDPVASLIICLFIAKAAYDIFMDAVNKMVDTSCDEETIQEMRNVILSCSHVIRIDDLKTRLFGSRIYVETEIAINGDLSLKEAHTIAHAVHDAIEKHFPDVKHCTVHMNPDTEAN